MNVTDEDYWDLGLPADWKSRPNVFQRFIRSRPVLYFNAGIISGLSGFGMFVYWWMARGTFPVYVAFLAGVVTSIAVSRLMVDAYAYGRWGVRDEKIKD